MNIALYISFGISGIIFAIVFGYLYLDKISNLLKKHWFEFLFSLCAAVLGFIIMNNEIGGKIFGAVLFFAIGWGIAWFLEIFIGLINNKIIKFIIHILLCLLLLIFAVTREYGYYRPKNTKINYKKCAMCGDKVPEDDMEGKWCKDCQNDAFGKDGWYNKIKD